MKVSTVEEMRMLDREAIERYGIEEILLMENAGIAVYYKILERVGVKGYSFIVFCGSGNNGGDGFVVARKLFSSGGSVKVYLLGNPEKMKDATLKNFNTLKAEGVSIINFAEASTTEIEQDIKTSDAVIDALLGTGIGRDVTGTYAQAVELINQHARLVFSVDIPSGINGNTGKVMKTAVKADYTITFGLPKIGNLLYPGYQYCGKLSVSHISFPPKLYNKDELKVQINTPTKLPSRAPNGHKGTFGDVLFIGGATGYYGAPYFSSLAHLKAGGGYSRLATPKSVAPYIGSKGNEVVLIPMEETPDGAISLKNIDRLIEISKYVDMVVIGPGLSLDEEAQEIVRKLVTIIDKPLLIDGDGITAVSKDTAVLKKRALPTILTPHPREISRLTGIPTKQILENSIEILRETVMNIGAIIVLKGAHTLVGYPDGSIFINMTGNSGMATAGSGDILTGTISAMYGLGLDIEQAVRMGVFAHGLAGDIASSRKGEDGITASDILNYLPEAILMLRNRFTEVLNKYEIEVI